MLNPAYLSIIAKRKSIRTFSPEPLSGEALAAIQEQLSSLVPLYPEIQTQFLLVPVQEVKSAPKYGATHYIACFSQETPMSQSNAGFMLEQLDVYFSANGIGCCYLGMASPSKALMAKASHPFVMLLGIGKPQEPLHRDSLEAFKRKPLEEVRDFDGDDDLFAAVRLAPSAMNSQPWFFTKENDMYHAFQKKSNPLTAVILGKMNKLDMGIALCHAAIFAGSQGKTLQIVTPKALPTPPKGAAYLLSFVIL